jgi:hypothetical protein
MPKPKAVETAVKGADTIMLRMGKANNVIQWKEDMYSLATEEFGEVGTYFYTNVAYQYPFSHRTLSPLLRPPPSSPRTRETTNKRMPKSKRT